MDGPIERPCSTCGQVLGDHTVREWIVCAGKPTLDLPYEATPTDAAALYNEVIREQLDMPEGVVFADHVVARAMVMDTPVGKLPMVLHEFQMAIAGSGVVPVATVGFMASVKVLRGYGRLVRDTANGAANAAEGA